MGILKPRRGHRSLRAQTWVVALVLAATGLTACSGSSGHASGSTSGRPPSTAATTATSTSATSTSATSTSATSTSDTSPAPTPTKPAARCPVLPRLTVSVPLEPLPCTSVATLAAASQRAGLKLYGNSQTIVSYLKLTVYDHMSTTLPVQYPEVFILHLANGAVVQSRCTGLAGRPLNPVLKICADVGPSTRTDVARVEAWALGAEKTIEAKPSAILRLTSGKLYFLACSDPVYQPRQAGLAYQMQLFAQVGPGAFTLAQCKD